jgi:hypothetical protein
MHGVNNVKLISCNFEFIALSFLAATVDYHNVRVSGTAFKN